MNQVDSVEFLLLGNLLSDITLSFTQTTYVINENSGHIRATLSLNIPSSTIINISFTDISNTAIGT